jgi:DNA-binding transcriptional regulator GbsR (MarR family)
LRSEIKKSDTMPNYNERVSFIEETGIFFESLGMTRMAGRILGYLMVSDKELVSFDELTQVLQASKSSISTNLKALVQTKFIKPATLPGDRKTYYGLSSDMDWTEYFEQRTKAMIYLKELFSKGYNLRTNKKDKPSKWLSDTIEFYDWLVREFPSLIQRWKENQAKKED